ncbi:MAG: YihY/virulence factor BrkB family protein [Microbacteriaceae bacterium]|nr:YihY/virulence factor BrkB family protein [Microbacteriaceae bacterium]
MPTNPPPPDDAVKASWPTQLRKQTWAYLARRTLHEFVQDGGIDAAAGLTFFSVLSVFPAAVAIVSLIGVFGDGPGTVDRLLLLLDQVAPGSVVEVLRTPLTDIATTSTASFALIAGMIASLWSASAYVSAFTRAMNRIYEVPEGRPYWKRKPAQLAVTVFLVILVLIIAIIVAVSGPILRSLGGALGWGNTAVTVWDITKWPVLVAAVITIVTVLYATTPNIHQPRFRWLSPGAILAIGLLGAASGGFAYYLANFASYNRTFGTLTGVIIFFVWLFLVNVSLLFGAEFNTELERGRELQAGIRAEAQLQLPTRDTTTSDLAQRTAKVDEQLGALLREGEPLPRRTDTLTHRLGAAVLSLLERIRHRR